MANYLDSEKLNSILKDFYEVTKIRIAILDTNYRDVNGYPKEKAAVCSYLRTSKLADQKCRECDKNACTIARGSSEPYMYRCHAGLYEVIEPLLVNGIVVGYLFFAHMFCAENREQGAKEILERCKDFGLNNALIKKHIDGMTLLSNSFIVSASHLLATIATYLCMENLGFVKHDDNLPMLINKYISDNISSPISLEDLSSAMGVCKTKLCSLSRRYYGNGIHQHILAIRIEKAKELLENNPNIAVWEVAEKCGFNDGNYFISLFKKKVGITPKKYLSLNSGENKRNPSALIPLTESDK